MEERNLSLKEALKLNTELLGGGPQQGGDEFAGWPEVAALILKSRDGRRTRVVGIFLNDTSIIRLVGALLLEQQDEWQLDGRRVFSELSMAMLDNTSDQTQDQPTAALTAAA